MWLKLVSNKLEEGSNIPLRSYRVDIQHLILIQFKHNENKIVQELTKKIIDKKQCYLTLTSHTEEKDISFFQIISRIKIN